jgi:hypothetical protein
VRPQAYEGLSYSDRVSTPEKPTPALAALQDLGPFANTIGLTVTAASADELTASWTVSDG